MLVFVDPLKEFGNCYVLIVRCPNAPGLKVCHEFVMVRRLRHPYKMASNMRKLDEEAGS